MHLSWNLWLGVRWSYSYLHVLRCIVGGKQGLIPCVKIHFTQENSLLWESHFMDLVGLSKSCGESDHPQLVAVLPDINVGLLDILKC